MNEGKLVNQLLRERNRKLINWGLSVETAGFIELMDELAGKLDPNGKANSAQSLFIGILKRVRPLFDSLPEAQVRELVNDGFLAMQERKRKRLKTGVITRHTFESEFPNGGEIFAWLQDNAVLKHVAKDKGYFKCLSDHQRESIILAFPNHYGRIISILELSQERKFEPKPQYFYQNLEIKTWRNL
jgi:hypothetical protein